VVAFSASPDIREALREPLEPLAEVVYLAEVDDDERAEALASADAVIAWDVAGELRRPEEFAPLESAGLLQLLSAGVDRVPFERLPERLPVAANAGAYADPMAEHVLAMALALAKQLPQKHAALARGEFDQQSPTLAIRGSVVGVLGFGGIGRASAELFRALGARIHAINTSGRTDAAVDWVGTLDELDGLLAAADVLVISLPLTRVTTGLLGERELSLMKPDAILVNVARAAIVDEDALYEHLRANPSFSAGLDAWWQEPRWQGTFSTRRPFLELPNVLGSPHNSAMTAGAIPEAARRAAENVARHLCGERPRHLVDRFDYVG
jgi:phosphoglycerate dehydrogenase-like enzyme